MAEIHSAEKGFQPNGSIEIDSEKEGYTSANKAYDTSTGYVGTSTGSFAKLRHWIRSAGAEEGGIERIPEELRTNQKPHSLFTIFMSSNICVATLAFGTLGPGLFGLGFWDSFCCLLFFNIIGSVPCALMATMGPKMGLRTMVLPRYSFGWFPAKIIAFIALLNQIGWAMVNSIVGAEFLYDVGDEKLPLAVAVLLICK
jgi:purine-cytosine permease-like protein